MDIPARDPVARRFNRASLQLLGGTAANGGSVTYVWHGQTFVPTAPEILFSSVSMLGFFGAGALFFLGGLVALAQAIPHEARRRTAAF